MPDIFKKLFVGDYKNRGYINLQKIPGFTLAGQHGYSPKILLLLVSQLYLMACC